MIAGCEHGRVVKVLAHVTAESLFDGHQACEGRAQPVGRVGDVEGIIAKDVHDNVGWTEEYPNALLVVMAVFVLPESKQYCRRDGRCETRCLQVGRGWSRLSRARRRIPLHCIYTNWPRVGKDTEE